MVISTYWIVYNNLDGFISLSVVVNYLYGMMYRDILLVSILEV